MLPPPQSNIENVWSIALTKYAQSVIALGVQVEVLAPPFSLVPACFALPRFDRIVAAGKHCDNAVGVEGGVCPF